MPRQRQALPARRASWTAGRRYGKGFSLVELLVAIAIGMVITLALGMLMTANITSRADLQKKGERLENGRFAIESLRDDLALAGYYGSYWPGSKDLVYTAPASGAPVASGTWGWGYLETASWTNPSPCATATADLGWLGTSTPPGVPLSLTAYDAGAAALAGFGCLQNLAADSDVLIVRRTETAAVAASTVTGTSAELHLQVSDCYGLQESGPSGAAFPFDQTPFALSRASTDLTMRQANCSSLAAARRYLARAYYIGNCNLVCGGSPDGVPTLRRADLLVSGGALTVQTVPLAPGVEHLQLQFGIDSDGDGMMDDAYQDPTAVTDWNNVVTGRVLLVARDSEPTAGFVDSKAFAWPGASATIPAATGSAAAFRRQAFTTTVNLMNVGARRE